jgi:hypothetical protein
MRSFIAEKGFWRKASVTPPNAPPVLILEVQN